MRKLIGLAAAGAAMLAVPALAQQSDEGAAVLNRVLNAILGPQPNATPTPSPTGTPSPGATGGYYGSSIDQVLAHPRRGEDGARDIYRHPKETLDFFQVRPGMTVVDYMPNGWWYTRILVPYLGRNGRYIAMNPDVRAQDGYLKNTYSNVASALATEHRKWSSYDDAAVSGFNTENYPDSLDGMVDRVLLIREMHNQFRYGWLNADLLAIRKMLKPDGLVGVIDHRMYESAPFSLTDGNKGYLRQSDVIALMDAYGFDLVSSSEVNANPRDPKDYRIGVWELPPNYAGAQDQAERDRRDAIGESDRMTLLFRKRD